MKTREESRDVVAEVYRTRLGRALAGRRAVLAAVAAAAAAAWMWAVEPSGGAAALPGHLAAFAAGWLWISAYAEAQLRAAAADAARVHGTDHVRDRVAGAGTASAARERLDAA